MANFYTKYIALFLFVGTFCSLPLMAFAMKEGDPVKPDSLAAFGHCSTVIEVDTNCVTGELVLSAFINWTWTGVHQPMSPLWSNGIQAHKITVEPPGSWTWDASGASCEIWHTFNVYTSGNRFFNDTIEITGPIGICSYDGPLELTLNLNGYNEFAEFTWTPENPTGEQDPYPLDHGGTYTVNVTDAFGCKTSDQITVTDVPVFNPLISGPIRICPEGDTATLAIVNPNQYVAFEWTNGETTSPITVFEPGTYDVTATESHGCTGVGSLAVQSSGVDPFAITASSPSLCPGLTDTLRVVGGYSAYLWSNNVSGITNVVNQAGTYTVTVTNPYGCTGTSSTTLLPLLPPNIQVTQTPLCLGDSAVLSTIGGSFPHYTWSSGQTTEFITALQPGTYTVTVSGVGVCTTSTNTVLDFAAAPVTAITLPNTLSCAFNQVPLDGSGSSSGPGFQLSWSTQGGHFVAGDSTLNPTVDQPGIYILSIVNDSTGCITKDTAQVLQDITPPQADAGTASALTCSIQHLTVGPTPVPVDPNMLPNWSTPDGNIVSGSNSWLPDINLPGTYMLTVTNAVNGCTNTASVMIQQDITPPVVLIAPTDLITCMQGTVLLDGSGSNNGPGYTYLWTTQNGILAGPTNAILSGASSIGTYHLLVTNTQNGCTNSASVPVNADINIPIVSALTPSTLSCDLGNTVIDASASSTGPAYLYNWTTQNGNIVSGGNTLIPIVNAPGIYTLHLVNSVNNCAATLAVAVNQNIAQPVADAGQDDILNCAIPTTELDGSGSSSGANFTYQWTSLNGHILSGNTGLNPVVDLEGTYLLQVTDQINGCTSSASVVIMTDANAPSVNIAAPATLTCSTLQTIIDATGSSQTGNLNYVWSGGILAGQGTLQPTVDQPGIYTLSITNLDNGCTEVASVTVDQNIAPPIAFAGANGLINCFNPTGSIGSLSNSSGPGFSVQWTSIGGHFTTSTNGPTATIDQAGDYVLLITNTQNGCSAADSMTVLADFATPLASAGPTAELTCVQTSVALQGNGSTGANFSYLWTATMGGNIMSGSNTLNPVVDAPGLYNLLVSNTQNGCTAAGQVNITENANGPIASAGLPQTLTCTFTSTTLSAAGSSTGAEYAYAWSANAGGNINSGANTFTPGINAPGTYIVTVTNTTNLCTQTASVNIVQNIQAPLVNAGLDALLTCAITALPLQAQIVSSSSPNIAYLWATNNGQILNGGNTASPTIGAPGNYQLTVTDAINGCTGTDQLIVTQNITPPVVLISNPLTLTCAAPQINLNASASSAGANYIYQWTTQNGHLVSTQNQQQPTLDAPGDYTLLITDTNNGCTQAGSVMVPQDIELPIVEAGAAIVLDCDTPTNTLQANGSSQGSNFSLTWSTTNGIILSGGNTPAPLIGGPGVYVLTILNTQNGCSNTDNVTVTTDVQAPVLAIVPPQTLTCIVPFVTLVGSGNSLGNSPLISWSALSGGNILSGGNTLQPIVDAPGSYVLSVQNTANGCTATLPVTVTENIQIPPVQVQPAALLTCTVEQTTLQGTVPAQAILSWSTTNGHIVSGQNTLSPTVDAPGTYLISVTAQQNGCTNTAQVTVLQEQNIPTGLQYKLQPPLCNGTPGLLSVDQVNGGIGPFSYSVDGGQSFFTSAEFNQLSPGSYDLVIQDMNGCEVITTVDVPSPLIPLVTAPPSFEIELGANQEIQALVPPSFPLGLVDTVIWSPMDGLTFSGNSILQLLNPVADPYHTTQYNVTIVTKEGCKATARTLVKVDREVNIYAPNIIRPDNPDGDNGIFLLFARDESVASIKKIQIYDRWGSMVFANKDLRPNDTTAGWGGDYKGVPVNPGVFVWWAEVELIDGRLLEVKGDVTVLR